ncbi:hypothetical protein AB6E04_22070 [Vibrio amylolyticus]|uniref:hypothetical protein n=1 Tax=Vibrio amylolyticus TaxID=2847292 RepID=UPI00354BA3B8
MKDYRDYINGALFGLLLLVLWYFSSLVIQNSVIPKSWDYFLRFATNVLGVMLGALLAFKFNRKLDSERERKNNEISLMLARFVLNRKLHRMKELYEGHLKEWKNNPDAWHAMKPLQHIEMMEGNVNFDSLSFLISTNELDLFEAFRAEEKYTKAIAVINERSDFHSDDYQNIFTELGDHETYEDFEKDMETRFPKIIGDLKSSTTASIELAELAIACLHSALNKLSKIQAS